MDQKLRHFDVINIERSHLLATTEFTFKQIYDGTVFLLSFYIYIFYSIVVVLIDFVFLGLSKRIDVEILRMNEIQIFFDIV